VEVRCGEDGSVVRLKTKRILIATGSHAVKIPIPGAEYAITSDEALVLENLGQSNCIVIIGGGYIAVEFAGIFAGLGAKVHLMYRAPYPLRGFDEECRAIVAENLSKRGVTLYPECNPTGIEKQGDGSFVLKYQDTQRNVGGIPCGQVMMATGRKPSSRSIGLENADVEVDSRSGAIKVDEYSRTSVDNIWAIGDVTDRMNLTPVALMEGKCFASTVFGNRPQLPDYNNIPTAVFCQPPLGTVGLTENQAVEQLHGDLEIYVSKFRPMKNTLSGRDEKTFMKMIVHCPTNRVVGCHMVGPDAGEIMQGLGVALKCGATKEQFDSTVGIHPSAAEEWVTMSAPARKVQGQGKGNPVK
jgi:glutathione reductase (NADPH)